MAITPDQVLHVTDDEVNQLEAVEQKIDRLLTKQYRPAMVVYYPIGKRWRPGFIAALVRRYEQSGWSVTVVDSDEEGAQLRFEPLKRASGTVVKGD